MGEKIMKIFRDRRKEKKRKEQLGKKKDDTLN